MKYKSPFRASRLLIALFFFSSVVGFTSGDGTTEKTWVDIAGGIGSFTRIIRDCSGNIVQKYENPFTDLGLAVQHTYGYGTFIGRMGVLHSSQQLTYFSGDTANATSDNHTISSNYIGGGLGLNFPYFGIDLGVLYFQNVNNYYFPVQDSHLQPMGRMRIGFEDSWYFSTSLMYNTPLIARGGLFDMGLGFKLSGSNSSVWLGMGSGPYYGGQFIARTIIQPLGWQGAILLSGNVGLSSDATEYGLSLGLRWNFQ